MAFRRRKQVRESKYRFESEVHLCDQLITAAKRFGFKVYPETSGFDLLLVATEKTELFPFKPGDQIGVQAKQAGTLEVLCQAMPHDTKSRQGHPNYYAVLVPAVMENFKTVAERCGIAVLSGLEYRYETDVDRADKEADVGLDYGKDWRPSETCGFYKAKFVEYPAETKAWVPEVEVSIPAGASGPRQLTAWKFRAIKLAMKGVLEGSLVATDFDEAKIAMKTWLQRGWLRPLDWTKNKDGKRIRTYEVCHIGRSIPPHLSNPEIVEALVKEGIVG